MTSGLKMEWDYSGRMKRNGKARKQIKPVRRGKGKDTKKSNRRWGSEGMGIAPGSHGAT